MSDILNFQTNIKFSVGLLKETEDSLAMPIVVV